MWRGKKNQTNQNLKQALQTTQSVLKEDHVGVAKCRVGPHTSPDSDGASQVNIFWSGPDPVQT